MTLAAVVCFFVFVIFALDIRPFLRRMRDKAKNIAAAMTPEPVAAKDVEKEEAPVSKLFVKDTAGKDISAKQAYLAEQEKEADVADEKPVFNAGNNKLTENIPFDINGQGEEKEEAVFESLVITEEEEEEEEEEEDAIDDTKLSFEVKKKAEEKTIIKNNAHISIADNGSPMPLNWSCAIINSPHLTCLKIVQNKAYRLIKKNWKTEQKPDHSNAEQFWYRDTAHQRHRRPHRNTL